VQRAGSLIDSIMKDLGLSEGVALSRIKSNWPELFQPPLVYHMSPSALREAELLLNVDSPEWLQQLSFYREEILKRLGPFGVKEVRFRLGRVRVNSLREGLEAHPGGLEAHGRACKLPMRRV